ncbi:hypothetical protein QQ008_27165 [Fulvivirgaceae bacterium BMA10]|uniref:Serine protease n=1 Tax=Splendidivirga corallicola TaxID=3051826 RepID=A0ABT8KYT7_9BACT|nr:hypothetical protein [Fulvivirgaceae bacterium BMA10]
MKSKDELMILHEDGAEQLQKVHDEAAEELLNFQQPRANLVGLADGVKWVNGEPTGEPSLIALVNYKLPKSEVSKRDMIPKKIQGMNTDVLAVGEIFAGASNMVKHPTKINGKTSLESWVDDRIEDALETSIETEIETLRRRARPVQGGFSVGHPDVTAGTIGTMVYDMLPNGIGSPSKYYILSNNHVLANSNNAAIDDDIIQPGRADGGSLRYDKVAKLSRFIPINFTGGKNLVDAAIAQGEFHDLDRAIYWIGNLKGKYQKKSVRVGTIVQKTGRTTNFTRGRITGVNATVMVNYRGGRVARFVDQIVTTPMSAGGDSGSILTDKNCFAMGLLFAGSAFATIHNQIENVCNLLKIEVY